MAMAEVWDVQQLKLTWETRRDAPCWMERGAAVAHGSVGYFSSADSHNVFAYDSEKDDWSKLPECPQRNFGLAVINNLLTAVGGLSSGPFSYTNRLVSFNGSKWVTIFPPMPTKRYWLAVISAQNYLIAAGQGIAEALSTVEVMNSATREWYTAASLPEPIYRMSATVCGGRLYLLGGVDKNYTPTRAVFTCTLDSLLQSCHPPSQTPPHTNEAGVWQRIADVPMERSTCTTLNGRVLAVGGQDSHGTRTADVYMYNADSDSWPLVGHMSTARFRCLVVGLRDCIIAVGGCFSSSFEVGYLQLSGVCMVTSLTIHTQPANLCVILKVIHAGVGWVWLVRLGNHMTTKKLSDNSLSLSQYCQGKGEFPWSSYFSLHSE